MMQAASSAVLMVVLLGAATSSSSISKPDGQKTTSHCQGVEQIVYSCKFGKKVGSVCLNKDSVIYRFGYLGRPELAVKSMADWSNIHIGANPSQAGLSQSHIRFTNGKMHYVVHAGETGQLNENPGRRISGIEVVEGASSEKSIASLSCPRGTPFTSKYYDVHESAPADWDGWEADGGEFDVIY
jgi:hypothetical protein